MAIQAAVVAVALTGGVIVVNVARADDDQSGEQRIGAFRQTNLVSSIDGLGAKTIDTNLRNPWGLAFFPNKALWVANNATEKATLYNGDGTVVPLVVTIPDAPTGVVANPVPDQFLVLGRESIFIFAGEAGTIDAVAAGQTEAIVMASSGAAVYKGLAFGTNEDGAFLFVTNFFTGEVEVYDSNFHEITQGQMFHDPQMPKGFAPFGIENIDGNMFVTYAKQDLQKHDDVPGPGLGFVDVFDTRGRLVERFASRGPLNAPWGLARAPQSFGRFGGAILIGNFGNGLINAFDNAGKFLGTLNRPDGRPIMIDGLWSLKFGGFAKSNPDELYFTAGINDEQEGLLGEITPVTRRTGKD